jgi:hypothetical protein
MPFRKVGPNDYVSPSGRHWTTAQVRLYHATGGFKKKRTKEMTYDRLTADDILAEERARLQEAWGTVARAASAASRRSMSAAGKAGVAAGAARTKSYAAAQGRAKARGIARAVPVPKKGAKGKKPPKPKRIKVNVGKAAYNKVQAFGSGRERVMAR